MIKSELKKPGQLVNFRGRRCVVQPSLDPEMILLKPLGGSDDEIIAIFEPVLLPNDDVVKDEFELPDKSDLNSFYTAKLLYDAARLSFRQVSGPFRCMGKLSFRPRPYQLVPLIMALRQSTTRLLVADDVGVGKTIEALLILRELLERGTIQRFAIVCPPHLCEQWQKELSDKLDIEAEIIRSSTAATLERRIIGDDTLNPFNYYPFQVISIDYVKAGFKKSAFLKDAPELIIVDEAHTCARPQNQRDNQQQRFHLLKDLAEDKSRHVVLLTATPHSGKDEEFKSLLELLDPAFAALQLDDLTSADKKGIATCFIQRKRRDIERWLEEDTSFPKRMTEELPYHLHNDYRVIYSDVLKFARGISVEGIAENKARIKYFAALTLLRGIMSSPRAGFEMLQKRQSKAQRNITADYDELNDNPVVEKWDEQSDTEQLELIDNAGLSGSEWDQLDKLSQKVQRLYQPSKDEKVRKVIQQVRTWVKAGKQPILFCRFIATAQYVAAQLKEHLDIKNVDIRAITSELSDDERKEKIEEMGHSTHRVLVATDCLSEGINLQDKFNAIMHYDLPWNPNRLEQREGRVDRFGQIEKIIEVKVLFGEDNPIDVVVLKIILEKIKNIQNTSGVSISLAEDNRSVIDKVLKEVLLNPDGAANQFTKQLTLDFEPNPELTALDQELTNEIDRAKNKAEKIRSIFAHDNVRPEDVRKDLTEVDQAIGDLAALETFVVASGKLLGAAIEPVEEGYIFRKQNMVDWLAQSLGNGDKIHFSFQSPTPTGFRYIGRNHRFVEQLCHRIIADALDKETSRQKAARAAVFRSDAVKTQTALIQFRIRNVIREVSTKQEIVAEEMFLWGYELTSDGIIPLGYETCESLLREANALDISLERQEIIFQNELRHFQQLQPDFLKVVEHRSNELVKSHTKFSKYLGAKKFEPVSPTLPPDILGVYVLIPNPKI